MNEFAGTRNVSVLFYYDGQAEYARPVRLLWQGTEYDLGAVQFWHTTNHGGKLTHHYTLSDKKHQFVFRLALETDDLTWVLEGCDEPARPLRSAGVGRLVGAMS